jgi:hypothetical protein
VVRMILLFHVCNFIDRWWWGFWHLYWLGCLVMHDRHGYYIVYILEGTRSVTYKCKTLYTTSVYEIVLEIPSQRCSDDRHYSVAKEYPIQSQDSDHKLGLASQHFSIRWYRSSGQSIGFSSLELLDKEFELYYLSPFEI